MFCLSEPPVNQESREKHHSHSHIQEEQVDFGFSTEPTRSSSPPSSSSSPSESSIMNICSASSSSSSSDSPPHHPLTLQQQPLLSSESSPSTSSQQLQDSHAQQYQVQQQLQLEQQQQQIQQKQQRHQQNQAYKQSSQLLQQQQQQQEHQQVQYQHPTKQQQQVSRKKKTQEYGVQMVIELPINPGVVLLKGDIMVPTTFDLQFSRLSVFNEFKYISQLKWEFAMDTIEMVFEQKKVGIEDFSQLISLFQHQPDERFRVYAQALILHQQRIAELASVRDRIARYGQADMLKNLTELGYADFDKRVRQQVRALSAAGELQAFKVNMFKIEFEKADYRMTTCSSSRLLMALIGLDIEQLETFNMRQGIIEFLKHDDMFGVCKYFLHLENQTHLGNNTNSTSAGKAAAAFTSNVVLKTVDDLEIDAKVHWRIITNEDPLLTHIFQTKLQHFAIIQSYEINPRTIEFVKAYRRTLVQNSCRLTLENESDWNYQLHASNFINKFYPKSQ